jgi:serine protease AprX
MRIEREWFEQLIFRGAAARRFTQDSPVLPDVWLEYAQSYPVDGKPVDLILTPHRTAAPADLAHALRRRIASEKASRRGRRGKGGGTDANIAYHLASVVACLTFEELVRALLPLSPWWRDTFDGWLDRMGSQAVRRRLVAELARVSHERPRGGVRPGHSEASPDLLWTIRIVGSILLAAREKKPGSRQSFEKLCQEHAALVDAFVELVAGMPEAGNERPLLWTVSQNRKVALAVSRSTLAVKADAARRVFEVDTRNLAWAVLDSGIDALHPAFRKRNAANGAKASAADSRVAATFDFSHIRSLLNPDREERPMAVPRGKSRAEQRDGDMEERRQDLTQRLQRGRAVDWDGLMPFLEVPHDRRYRAPVSDHGTHVAGILAGNWVRDENAKGRRPPENLVGMCPDLTLYDLRVFDARGEGDEFTVMAALQLVRHLNSHSDQPQIHGANLSLSLLHDVANYACGRTPICDECERVVSAGIVVVAAAGNDGYMRYVTPQGASSEGYRSISISDPGNAEGVITVGATHRYQPHTYGVSYFSSRGPTGDGRLKPDLVAPGEKITAPLPGNGWGTKDGTSMAAPHVSGAAALLMARHRELVGRPQRIKEILCSTATDLGRERYFQGSGMVDVLRALQSV